MDYDKGTVLQLKNIRFKETDRTDLGLAGHPVVLPIEVNHNDDIYFFTSSSQTHHYTLDADRYFLTGNLPQCGLPDKSIIDLKHVYKWEHKNYQPKNPIPKNQLSKMIAKIVDYKNKNLDEDYVDFLDMLKS